MEANRIYFPAAFGCVSSLAPRETLGAWAEATSRSATANKCLKLGAQSALGEPGRSILGERNSKRLFPVLRQQADSGAVEA